MHRINLVNRMCIVQYTYKLVWSFPWFLVADLGRKCAFISILKNMVYTSIYIRQPRQTNSLQCFRYTFLRKMRLKLGFPTCVLATGVHNIPFWLPSKGLKPSHPCSLVGFYSCDTGLFGARQSLLSVDFHILTVVSKVSELVHYSA